MAVNILPAQIQNLQQIEAVVAGPDDANRLFIIDGQFSYWGLSAYSQGNYVSQKEIFTVLVGPVFARKQFFQANATASFTQTSLAINASPANAIWQILGVDADWDDESGQVELRIEAQLQCWGQGTQAVIYGFGFHVTILAAIAAA
jgi:hypothetical protein